jgi:hypothetical protein
MHNENEISIKIAFLLLVSAAFAMEMHFGSALTVHLNQIHEEEIDQKQN